MRVKSYQQFLKPNAHWNDVLFCWNPSLYHLVSVLSFPSVTLILKRAPFGQHSSKMYLTWHPHIKFISVLKQYQVSISMSDILQTWSFILTQNLNMDLCQVFWFLVKASLHLLSTEFIFLILKYVLKQITSTHYKLCFWWSQNIDNVV